MATFRTVRSHKKGSKNHVAPRRWVGPQVEPLVARCGQKLWDFTVTVERDYDAVECDECLYLLKRNRSRPRLDRLGIYKRAGKC